MQECEIATFNQKGSNNLGIIGQQKNSEASFIKKILTNSSDKKLLLAKLKKRFNILILITIIIFLGRNLNRIFYEIEFYLIF